MLTQVSECLHWLTRVGSWRYLQGMSVDHHHQLTGSLALVESVLLPDLVRGVGLCGLCVDVTIVRLPV